MNIDTNQEKRVMSNSKLSNDTAHFQSFLDAQIQIICLSSKIQHR